MLGKRKITIAFLLTITVVLIGFFKVNTEVTKTLGESNASFVKIHYKEKPFMIKIDLKNYEIELSKNVLVGFKEQVEKLIN